MPHLLPFRDDADRAVTSRIVRLAFAGTADGVADWMKLGGDENFRVLPHPTPAAGGAAAACLLRIPMGTFIGGRSLSLLGVAAVGVAPENRGQGLAKRLMQGFVRDAAEEGWVLAGLYASTHTLYRAVGFEHALHRFQYTVPLGQVDGGEDSGPLHPLTEADEPAVRRLYHAFAARYDGMLDRGPYIWSRTRKMRDMEFTGFATRDAAGALTGYVMLHQARRPDGRHDVVLSDLVFLTAQAGRRLLGFLADFAMMGHDLIFYGGPSHPALTLLRQQRYRVELKDSGLLRVLDVKRLLEGRGYPAGLSTTLHLDITDDLLPSNAGRWTLVVKDGEAAAERGGPGTVRASIRGLAAMMTGYVTPLQAKLLGEVDGRDEDLAAAGATFAHGTPWMCDMY